MLPISDQLFLPPIHQSSNAEGLESSYGLAPPEFSLTAAGTETKQDALNRHAANIQLTQDAIAEMKASSKQIEVNTAEWLDTNLNDFYVATKTHDSEARAAHLMGGSDFYAYFGGVEEGKLFPAHTANYDNDVTKYQGCDMVGKYTSARVVNHQLTLYDPTSKGNAKSDVKELLIHEVQHIADHLEDKENHPAPDNVDDAWLNYQSEFKSYWVSGEYDKFAPTGNHKGTGFNERQWEIYYHVQSLYPYVKKFEKDTITKSPNSADNGKKMEVLIRHYDKPHGFNLDNSPRIESFYKALLPATPTMNRTDSEIVSLFAKASALTDHEKQDIYWDDDKQEIIDLMKSNLSEDIYRELNLYLTEA